MTSVAIGAWMLIVQGTNSSSSLRVLATFESEAACQRAAVAIDKKFFARWQGFRDRMIELEREFVEIAEMWVPEPEKDGLRRYRKWAGDPRGQKEDTARCIARVADGGRSPLFSQCRRKRGHGRDGLFCAQHAKILSK